MTTRHLTEAEIEEIILESAKNEELLNPHNIYEFGINRKGLKADPRQVFDVFHRLVMKGFLRPDDMQWHRVTAYGRAALGDESEFIFLQPSAYIKRLKERVPNIDSITLQYIGESLEAWGHGLILSATVTLGAASESAILELVDSYCNFKNDTAIKRSFERTWAIKEKYELLKKKFRDDNLRNLLPQRLVDRGVNMEGIDRHFVEFETIIDNLFHVYRITRNDAGHPTGIEMDKDSLRCNIAAFRRYAESIFGIKAALDALG